ncbi:MAG: chloride channel protein [Terriglobales bacterium]
MSLRSRHHVVDPTAHTRPDRLLLLSGMSLLVGLVGGLVAEFLLAAIAWISNLLFFQRLSGVYIAPSSRHLPPWTLLLPAAGGLLVGLLIHFFAPEIKGDGIPEAMAVVLTNRSRIKPRVSIFKPLSAAITVGTGGPFGAEGPILQTGAALGSLLSRLLPTSAAERRTLLACGAAAGLAGVFKTPFAAVFIAVELLVFEFRARSFIPIALASATGTMVAMAFRGAAPVFPIAATYRFHASELVFFVVLGIGCAGLAWAMSRTLYFFEDLGEHIHCWPPLLPALGGLAVGALAFWHPQVLGMGYADTADLLANPHTLGFLGGVGLAKLLAFAIALGFGASGGTFAPALMIGSSFGAAFGQVVHGVLPDASSFGIYGMIATGALFGGIYRATPSAILFMLEVTGAYQVMFPLFLVCIITDLASHYFMETTINTERLVRRGIPVPDAFVADPMKMLRVRDVMTVQVESVRPEASLAEVLAVADHVAIPVVNADDDVVGMIRRSDLLRVQPGVTTAAGLARPEFLLAYPDEVLHDVALRMLASEEAVCAVVERQRVRLLGLVTYADLLKAKQWESSHELTDGGDALFQLATSPREDK